MEGMRTHFTSGSSSQTPKPQSNHEKSTQTVMTTCLTRPPQTVQESLGNHYSQETKRNCD